ncbi:MAG: glycoside hydrolase family 9 protein [Lachnospiraceae bacterium]|nr:glycoside hydrolase family 9 protein [Lachnospiraceae bacterium]
MQRKGVAMNTTTPSKIRVNMMGYLPGLSKNVVVLSDDDLTVFDDKGYEVRSFKNLNLKFDDASGDSVASIDLGDLPEGKYLLKSGDTERKISVQKKAYSDVTNALIKGLYYQRCGCALEEKYAGIYTHAACHTAPAIEWDDSIMHVSENGVCFKEGAEPLKKTVIGGWHDAGDYGKYVGPGAVTVAHMLYAYLLFPDGCSDALNIPETGNGTPDILNEARWELEWILKMQKDDGSFYHKLTKARFAPFIMPEDDKEQEYLIPVSHCATEAAIAALALASRVYEKFDKDFSEKMLEAALKGWKWVEANPEFKPYIQPEGVRTGYYGDWNDKDERFWAACELYAATSDTKYKAAAEKIYKDAKNPELIKKEMENNPYFERMKKWNPDFKPPVGLNVTQYGWADVAGLGALCCLFEIGKNGNGTAAGEVLGEELKKDFLEKSKEALNLVKISGYGTANEHDKYVWGSILTIMSNAMTMIVDWKLTGNTEMRDAALNQLNYALGLNALDISFITGFGERRVMNPHHRPSGADGIEEPVPGLISGGPNSGMNYPETKEKLKGTAPAKCYLDELPSADTNEIAIYWNSPAIFVAACFNAI